MKKYLFIISTSLFLGGCGSDIDKVSNLQLTNTAKKFQLEQLETCSQIHLNPEALDTSTFSGRMWDENCSNQKRNFTRELSRTSGLDIKEKDLNKKFWASINSEVIPFIKEERIKLYEAQKEERLAQQRIKQEERAKKSALDRKKREINGINNKISRLERQLNSKKKRLAFSDDAIKTDKKDLGGRSMKDYFTKEKKQVENDINRINSEIDEYKNQLKTIEDSLSA